MHIPANGEGDVYTEPCRMAGKETVFLERYSFKLLNIAGLEMTLKEDKV